VLVVVVLAQSDFQEEGEQVVGEMLLRLERTRNARQCLEKHVPFLLPCQKVFHGAGDLHEELESDWRVRLHELAAAVEEQRKLELRLPAFLLLLHQAAYHRLPATQEPRLQQ
jgi:hypothetical protein